MVPRLVYADIPHPEYYCYMACTVDGDAKIRKVRIHFLQDNIACCLIRFGDVTYC